MVKYINKPERKCAFCNTNEWDIRKVGNYMVVLKKMDHEGEIKLVCQGCKRNTTRTNRQRQEKKKNWLRKIFS